ARFQILAAALHALRNPTRQQSIRARQALSVRTFARFDHVPERFHALAPAIQRLTEPCEVAVILQAFLEVVSGEHGIEIAGLRRIRHIAQLPEKAVSAIPFSREDRVQHVARANAADRLVYASTFR